MGITTHSLTLAEKTYAVAFPEPASGVDTPRDALMRVAEALPSEYGAEWGLMLGIAIAIARGNDPYEPLESVVERALPAAAEAFKRYAGVDVLSTEAAA